LVSNIPDKTKNVLIHFKYFLIKFMMSPKVNKYYFTTLYKVVIKI